MSISAKSQSPKTLDDWLSFLAGLHHSEIDLGLERVRSVAERMGLCDLPGKITLIAGTNGKGTTSRFLERYLLESGYRVGVFNSPELICYNERIRIDGQMLADESHIRAFNAIEAQRGDTSLTSFEFSTLAALWLFSQYPLDHVLIEVGMGGRLDSTNIVNPTLSVITTIAIDHRGFLGDNREAIGFEKAGIFRPHHSAIVGDLDIPQSVHKHAQAIDCPLLCANADFCYQQLQDHWQWKGQSYHLERLVYPKFPIQNASTGLACLEQLGISIVRERVNIVLSQLQIEGRMQQISEQPIVLLDVAHNLESAGYLTEYLQNNYPDNPVYAVVGMLEDKEVEEVLEKVQGQISRWYLSSLDTPRTAKVNRLAVALEKTTDHPYSCYDDVVLALSEAKSQLPDDGLIVVFGSFFTVAAVLKSVNNR